MLKKCGCEASKLEKIQNTDIIDQFILVFRCFETEK